MNRGSSADGKQAPVDYDPFSGAPLERVVPTTESQREVWLADRLGRESSLAYNESITLRFIGQLELGGLRSALLDLVQRHEALRSTFGANGEELCIAKEGALDLVEADHSAADESVRQAAIAAAKQRAVETPFVLETGPLVRAEILKLGHADHVVILTSHHVVCDGWSFAVLVHDLLAIYAKRVHLASNELAPAVSFGDYAVAQSGLLGGEQAALDESYWLAQFREAVPILELPVDHARGAWRTFESRREDHTLDAALLAGLRKLGGQSGAGLFATSLGLFAVLLQRISGRDDLVVGVPAAGQSVDGFGSLVGHCVNLLPLRLRLDSSGTLAEAIATTQSAVLDAYEHQSYTMGSLLQKLPVERDPSRPTLISVMFNIDSAIDNKHDCPGLSVEIESNPRSYEVFEIFVNVVAVNDELRLECQYNANLFDAATIRAWLRCYETLLRAACDSQQATVGGVALSSPTDRDLLNRWNDTRRDFASGALVHELFEAQVVRVPSQPALVWRDTTLTYAEVERRANQLARTLQSLGVRRGALVGLHLERSPDWVAVMLAVLKVGAAYVPLDPSYPLERLEFMVADAGLAVVVSGESVAESLLPRERSLLLDADRELIAGQSPASLPRGADAPEPTDPAYVIYTSGSTGKPNGVCVPHRAVVNFLESMAREPGLAPDDRMVAVTTPSFDIAVTELILPLTVGAVTVLATQDEATDGASLCQLIASSAATAMQGTPATWRLLLSAGWRGGSQFKALCGGEELTANLAEKLLLCGVGELWNMYGPTETTVWSSAARITEIAAGISIGRPIANTRIWILDSRERLCPIGVPGEIWIGGDGVTLGYLGRPELTAARFLADSISGDSGAMVYRTGDRGRWRADGQLQHLGRLDFQVKVRGYRIELGEIEFRLALHSGIDAAVVIAREDRAGDVRLVAYYVPTSGSEPTVDALRAHLAHALPEYMLPQHLVCLPELPLLPNGKLDRKSLPVPDAQRLPITEYVAPGTDTERGVAEDMEAVLGMEGIGVHDDFFVLGGHSLLAAQLTYRVNSRFGHDLSMRTVFEVPTVARLAATIDGSSASPPSPRQRITRLENQRRAPASFMQERLWLLERMNPGRVVYHAPSAHRLQGALDERAFERALREVVRRQPVLRTEFDSHRHGLDQCVREDVVVSLFPAEDLSHVDPSDRDTVLLERLDELTNEKFDLSCAPLFKVRMIRLATDEHVLFFMPHHIIWDGWSFDLLYQEMSQLYAMYAQGKGTPLLPLEVSYCDFASWHQQWLKSAECERQIDFWRERMLQVQTPRPLPADHRRQSAMSGEGSTESIAIAKEQSEALHALAAQSGATQFVATLTVFGVLLHDFARESQFVIGTPVRARMVAEVEAIMGYFNNLMLLPLQVEASETFVELLDRVRASVVESFAVPGVPLEQIERALANADGDSAHVLYQALFSFQDVRQRATQWGDLEHSMIPLFQQGAAEDLGMWFVESVDGLQGGLTYNTDVFEPATAKWLVQRYIFLVERVLANPNATILELVGQPASFVAKRIAVRNAADNVERVEAGANSERGAGPDDQLPVGDLESQLAVAWRRVLGVDRVGMTDNFFDLGGNSLRALNLVTEIETSLGIRIDPNVLVRSPTIAGLVASLSSPSVSRPTELVVLRRGGVRNLFLVHDGEGSTLPYLNLARHLPVGISVFGIEPPSHPGVPLAITSIAGMATSYIEQMQRHQPRGPYLLGGLCAGGLIAYEMAVQLERRGDRVELVAILDAGTPQATVKRGLPSARRRERFWLAVSAVRDGGGSTVSRAWKVFLTFVERSYGALAWAVSSRIGRAWAWARVCLLRRMLCRGWQWPSWMSPLTFHQIYVYAVVRYVPSKLHGCKVVLVRPRPGGAVTLGEQSSPVDDTPYVEIYADEDLGWSSVVDHLTIVDVDGGHSSMLWEPYVLSLARALEPFSLGESSSESVGKAAALDA